jgi:DNA invertase Pin-like site-specific DNA recombinase
MPRTIPWKSYGPRPQIYAITYLVAERRGSTVIEVYRDAGISGSKGRDKRPGLDAMLKDANRRKFDVVMTWAIDRSADR